MKDALVAFSIDINTNTVSMCRANTFYVIPKLVIFRINNLAMIKFSLLSCDLNSVHTVFIFDIIINFSLNKMI